MRAHARAVLAATDARLAVLGHSHRPALCHWPEGIYLNPGSWALDRTFGCLRNEDIALMRWNGERAVAVDLRDDK